MILGASTWGEAGLWLVGVAALVAAVSLTLAGWKVRALATEWIRVARVMQEAAEAVREAAEAAKGAAGEVERRAQHLSSTVDAVTRTVGSVGKTAESARFLLVVLEKTALPVLIRMAGWRAGLAEGLGFLLARRGRRKQHG